MLGMDPFGNDEYAGFANVPWTEIPPQLYGNYGYDISPPIGFSAHKSPEFWNYHVPGFMTASLLHEEEYEVTCSFMWTMRDVKPEIKKFPDASSCWWGGPGFHSNYSGDQCRTVILYLEYLRDFGSQPPVYFEWTRRDLRALLRWSE